MLHCPDQGQFVAAILSTCGGTAPGYRSAAASRRPPQTLSPKQVNLALPVKSRNFQNFFIAAFGGKIAR